MSVLSFLLVLLAAVTHAAWNLLAKRAADAGPAFVFAYNAVICVLLAPWMLWVLARGGMAWSWAIAACIGLSAVANFAYSLCLQRGYQVADLSVVYPVARGSAPLLASVGAILLLGEMPTMIRVLGLLAVIAGIACISTRGRVSVFGAAGGRAGVAWGMATGGIIACYTLVDAWGIQVLDISPVALVWFSNLLRAPMLAPMVLRDPRRARELMRGKWGLALGVGLLAPLSYILVLAALGLGAPVSAVAPMREMSMMIAALFGGWLLREPLGPWRWAGCILLTAGVAMLGAG